MTSDITPEKIQLMEQYLKDHPIDPAYDEEMKLMDGDIPYEQFLARIYQKILNANK